MQHLRDRTRRATLYGNSQNYEKYKIFLNPEMKEMNPASDEVLEICAM